MLFLGIATPLLFAALSAAVAPPGPWDAFNFAPDSRTVRPYAIHSTNGSVQGAQNLVTSQTGNGTLSSSGSFIVLDFAKEVGGQVSINIVHASPGSALSLSFTESAQFISPINSDDSCRTAATMDSDGVQSLPSPLLPGTFTQALGQQRGGFRFLTIVSNANAPVTISAISVHITFMPHREDLRQYGGYFFAHDPSFHDPDFLTKLWYAGAYTVQTNTIDVHQARQQPCPSPHGWANNATGGPVEGPILVDGAKRDRNIWPGDMGISSHTELVSLNDLLPTKNALAVMFSTQDPATGALQYSGPPINARGSDTYIAWSLIGTHNYYLYTGDLDFVQTVWQNYSKAIAFLQSQVDGSGLMNVPAAFQNDWGRDGGQGRNSAANAVLYRALITGADLAHHLGDSTLSAAYAVNATALKTAYNDLLWDAEVGMFRDNDNTNLHPQDGNALAVLFNVTISPEQNDAISKGLTSFWTDIGPLSPELNDTIIPFVGGFEWGYMLYTNLSVQSTLLEGFTANGSLGYRAAAGYDFDKSYTSHSHGWATGPTPALSFFVLGITLTSAKGATWQIAPVLSGLEAAEGGFETSLGWFGVNWQRGSGTLTLRLEAPKGTTGRVFLPGVGVINVDGKVVRANATDKGIELDGGKHVLTRKMSA